MFALVMRIRQPILDRISAGLSVTVLSNLLCIFYAQLCGDPLVCGCCGRILTIASLEQQWERDTLIALVQLIWFSCTVAL
jgi:hypothetical protein